MEDAQVLHHHNADEPEIRAEAEDISFDNKKADSIEEKMAKVQLKEKEESIEQGRDR